MSVRSFSGDELHGDNLVRIVYVDESGTSTKQQEPHVIVAGAIVHGDHQLNKLRIALTKIMDDHIPTDVRQTLVLHACDIYGGNGYFDTKRKPEWTYERRMAILHDLAKIPTQINLKVTWARVDKAAVPREKLGMKTEADFLVGCVGIGYMSCMIEVDQWFRQNARGENCFVVVEDNRDTRQFIKQAQQQHQSPAYALQLNEQEREYFPLRHIHEDPNFQEKRVAHPLVLADFLAYFVKRRFMSDERSYQFSDPWIDLTASLQVKLPHLGQR